MKRRPSSPVWSTAPPRGESFVIAKAGKPLVKVAAIDAPAKPRRLGFLKGEIEVPEDFDRMGEREIAALFGISA